MKQGFPGGTEVKDLPDNAGDAGDSGSIPGWEDALEKGMACPFSSILPWSLKESTATESIVRQGCIWLFFFFAYMDDVSSFYMTSICVPLSWRETEGDSSFKDLILRSQWLHKPGIAPDN